MYVATTYEVGVRELKNRLSHYLALVRQGDDIVVTDHGRPVARLSAIGESHDRLAELVEAGLVRPPTSRRRRTPPTRIPSSGSVSDLVAEQRR